MLYSPTATDSDGRGEIVADLIGGRGNIFQQARGIYLQHQVGFSERSGLWCLGYINHLFAQLWYH